MGTVYLIHFDQPFSHARHYIGWTHNGHTLRARLDHHQNGSGARLMRAVSRAGIPWRVVRTWRGMDRHFERRLKNQNNSARLCPICNPTHWKNHPKLIQNLGGLP